MKRNFYLRRLKSRAEVGTKRRLNLMFLVKGAFILAVIAMAIIGIVYLAVYNGYQSKLIQNIEDLPTEYKQATVILDVYNENDNLLLAFLDKGYESRKFTNAKIYSTSERDLEDLKSIIKKFPLNRVEFNLENTNLIDICLDMKKNYPDQKTIIIANPDIAVRAATICNNLEVLAIPSTIEDTDYLVYNTSFQVRLSELIKILFDQLENNPT